MKEDKNEELFSEKELEEGVTEESLVKKGLNISETWLYKFFVKIAYKILSKPLTILKVLKSVLDYLKKHGSIKEITVDVRDKVAILTRLLHAYSKGKYTEISKMNAALTLGALLYLLTPLDLIPDFFLGGLLDDIAILTWVFKNFKSEIDSFLAWEQVQTENWDLSTDIKKD